MEKGDVFMRAAALTLVAGLALQAVDFQKPSSEMETSKPEVVILPPPRLVDVKVGKGTLVVNFRHVGTDRAVGYNLYRFDEGKWLLLGDTPRPPATLTDCAHGTASYAVAAVDKSREVGSKTRFTADYTCAKLAPGRK